MKILTHPDNLKYVKAIIPNIFGTKDTVHAIVPWNTIPIITDPLLEKEKWTGKWLVDNDRFVEYWDGQGEPPSWIIYFGLARKEMELNFYIINEPTVFRGF